MSAQPTEAISLAAATHMLRVLAEPDRVIGRRATDSLDVVLAELERLQAMERRANEVRQRPTPWHPKDGPKHAWQQAVAEYIATGEDS